MLPWQAAAQRRREVWRFLYALFLKSPEWADLREIIKERNRAANDGDIVCERCHSLASLDWCVHHVRYDAPGRTDTPWPSGWLPFPETGALELLCSPCHNYLHHKTRTDPIAIAKEIQEKVDRILQPKVEQGCALRPSVVQRPQHRDTFRC